MPDDATESMPSLLWEQQRVLQYVMEKKAIPEYQGPVLGTSGIGNDEVYAARAAFFRQFIGAFAQLGTLPAEMRFTLEPLHPLPAADLERWLTEQLGTMGAAPPTDHAGLSALSRGLFTSYGLGQHMLFESVGAPADHPDLFLFDPLAGFVLWSGDGRTHNFWLGNQRDIIDLERMPPALKGVFLQSHSDHFSLGKSLFLRVVGPLLHRRRHFELDEADIPTILIDSQSDLDAFGEDLREACARAPLPISLFFRGQTTEYPLPDRSHLVKAGITLYSDVRDHSLVPSLYRRYDSFLDNPLHFRAFISLLQDWSFCSDMVFGEPAVYMTLSGEAYTPKPTGAGYNATMSLHMGGFSGEQRAFEDLQPYTVWNVTDHSGEVVDTYVKLHRPGHDSVRRNLILQHYGAPTSYIDVTRDIRVAEWFALNRISIGHDGLSISDRVERPHRTAAIFVFTVMDGLAPVVDTASLTTEEEALRPHRQACAVLGGAGNLYRNAASRFIALKIKFSEAFEPSGLPTARHLFPGPDEDHTLKQLLELYADRYPWPDKLPIEFPVYRFPEMA